MDYKKTLAFVNNNLTNIKYDSNNHWQGQIGQNKTFCVFETRYHGFRAAFKIMMRYIERGVNTPRKIIQSWVGYTKKEYDPYVRVVQMYVAGIDEPISFEDRVRMLDIVMGMVRMESGTPIVDMEEYATILTEMAEAYRAVKEGK